MSLAEISRVLLLAQRKQPAAGLPRDVFLDSVRPRVVTPAVGPGLTRTNHLRAQIVPVEPDAGQCAAVSVVAPDSHLHLPVQCMLRQQRARRCAAGLTDLGRVNAVDAQLARRTTRLDLHPKCVAVRNIGDFSAKRRLRMDIVCY